MSETDSRGGLYLVIVGKSRTWMFRYKRRGKGHWMGLGPDSLVSLATARDAAIDARRLLRQGVEAGLVVQNSGAERLAVCGMPSTGVSNPTARGQTASMEQAVAGGHPTARGQGVRMGLSAPPRTPAARGQTAGKRQGKPVAAPGR
jgi:hypothetical protein